MVVEIKSISCVESLKKIPEIFGLEKDNNWMNLVHYSFTTKTGTLVLAYQAKIIVLSNKWDSRSNQYKYSITWSDELTPYDEITAVLCLPIPNENNELVATILIGFSSGKLDLITDRGKSILSQQWYPESVRSIQLPNDKKTIDEIYVVYKSCVCILQSKQLMQYLKNIDKIGRTNQLLGSVSCRVWKYSDSYGRTENVANSAVIGSKQIGLFDHLLAASMEGGFYAKYRSSAPQQLAVLSIGTNPFASFYYAKELIQPQMTAAIAQAVATTVKNVLPSWLTGAQKTPLSAEPTPTISTESMILRYGFYDDHRSSNRIWLSPYNQLAAIADSLGRIILIDCAHNIIIRVWKGYRDAQCSFMKVDEKLSKNSIQTKRKHTLFLAIYSPKRSTVDVWNIRGRKLAAFPAGSNGQLIQQYSYASQKSTHHHTSMTAFFLNPIDLTVKELTIPFHYALDTANTKKSKDIHIINQIKVDLKSVKGEDGLSEIIDLCDSIQTNEMRFKCIQTVIKSRHLTPKIFESMLNTFLKCTDSGGEDDAASVSEETPAKSAKDAERYSNERLSKFLYRYERLLLFYNGMKHSTPHNDSSDSEALDDCDFEDVLRVVDRYKGCLNLKKTTKVSIQSPSQSNDFIEYLSIFDCASGDNIRLHESKSNRFSLVGFDLFDTFIKQNSNVEGSNFDGFYKLATVSTLSNVDLLRLFLKYWMEKEVNYNNNTEVLRHLVSFTQIFQTICDLDRESAEHNYNSLSPWWQNIREMLLEHSSVFKALLAAMLCRDLSVLYRQKENYDSTSEDDVWEQVSQETAQWSLLIGKLDDIAALSSILSFKPNAQKHDDQLADKIPRLEYTIPEISLFRILNGGNGIVSELVAKWIAASDLKPSQLITPESELEATEEYSPNSPEIYLDLLRKHFPFSLKTSILLCHLSWEYVYAWSCDVRNFKYLDAALEYLNLFESSDNAIKHGICCIIWNEVLRKYMKISIKLVNQIGNPGDESKPHEAFTDVMIPDFMGYCYKFLNHLVETDSSPLVILKFEELLQDDARPALATRAIQQSRANLELIELHFQLIEVMLIITSLNVTVKNSMNSLFNDASKELFACDISTMLTLQIPRPDDTLNKTRRHFLHRTINAAVDLIRKDFQEVYTIDFVIWTEKVMQLGQKWTLNLDDLQKYQIIQLYTRGWDEFAEKKLSSLEQPSTMGKTLLSIAGTRLNHYVKDKPDLYSRVLATGSRMSAYLEKLEDSPIDKKLPQRCDDDEEDDCQFGEKLVKLARKAYECLSQQEGADLKLSAQLFDSCIEVKDYANSKKN